MFPRLQRKFVILYTFSTGLIMTFILSVAFLFYVSSQDNRLRSAFQEHLFTLTAQMQTDSEFSDSFLAQMEQNNKLLIYIEENDIPFFFPGAFRSCTPRATLLTYAKNAAKKEYIYDDSHPISSNILQSSVFQITGDKKDTYLGNVLILRTSSGYKRLTLLMDITGYRHRLLDTGCIYLLIDLCGILLLFLSGRWFVSRSLKPLEETCQKQQDFVAAVSHELRSPFAVIRTTADAITANAIAADTVAGSAVSAGAVAGSAVSVDAVAGSAVSADKVSVGAEGYNRGLTVIKDECRRGSSLIQNLLLLVTAEQKEWAVKKQDFEIDELLLNLLEIYEPLCRSKGGALLLILPQEPLPSVSADPDLCRQIFTILLDNAVAYALTDPLSTDADHAARNTDRYQILLRADISHGHICIRVTDHGPGIPDEEKTLIFDRFYRSDRSRNDKEHFGLGLSIAAALAKIQGLRLAAEDTEGGGSTFSLRF